MIIKSAEFIKSAVKSSHYPDEMLPEVAFAGRSNVGKSSLINTLVNRKRLVKTSSTPGRTQLINFFDINKSFSFVDLPGFGYAKVPKKVKREWAPMIETYLSSRQTLKCVILLMDIRRIPKEDEKNFIDWFHHFNLSRILVLTKADKLSKQKAQIQQNKIAKELEIDRSELLLFSSKTRAGKEKIWKQIEYILEENPEKDDTDKNLLEKAEKI